MALLLLLCIAKEGAGEREGEEGTSCDKEVERLDAATEAETDAATEAEAEVDAEVEVSLLT